MGQRTSAAPKKGKKTLHGYQSEGLADWAGPLLQGTLTTLEIALAAYAIGILLGLMGALAKLGKVRVLAVIASAYSTIVRAVPELLLIIILFYAGTQALTALMNALGTDGRTEVSGFVAAIAVLAFVQGAYMTEVFRGAILAIPKGQLEAADAYGMTAFMKFRRITVPAMLPNALSGMSNLWLILIKDTALVSVVGFEELFFTAQQAAASTNKYFTFYAIAGVTYLMLTMASNAVFSKAEKLARHGQARS